MQVKTKVGLSHKQRYWSIAKANLNQKLSVTACYEMFCIRILKRMWATMLGKKILKIDSVTKKLTL